MARVPRATIVATLLGRLLLLPLAMTCVILFSHRLGFLQGIDQTALVVMMMMNATPTALMVHSVATMLQNKADDIASILFW